MYVRTVDPRRCQEATALSVGETSPPLFLALIRTIPTTIRMKQMVEEMVLSIRGIRRKVGW